MAKYFGTDGFRGEAGRVLTAEHAFLLGRALAVKFGGGKGAVIGKDTRRSSYMLEYAIASGLASMGKDAYMLHVSTTPCVTFSTVSGGFDLGVMISASHNLFSDNGIKVVDKNGEKLGDRIISEIEELMDNPRLLPDYQRGEGIGRIIDYREGRSRYIEHLSSLTKKSFRGMRIGIDGANGGAYSIAKEVFERLGAEVYCIGDLPNGSNINDGVGSTHPEGLADLVVREGLDLGFAFDGDGDRCISVDEYGGIVNGDHTLFILARELKSKGKLAGNTVVTTVMSNLGLYHALDEIGVRYEITDVGDRYVAEKMRESGFLVGGEQSGHTILSEYASGGDGIQTAIKLAEAVIENKSTIGSLAKNVKMLPQVLVNVKVREKSVIDSEKVGKALTRVKKTLGDRGRILIRKSGTEPVIRIMTEAPDKSEAQMIAEYIKGVILEADNE